MSRYRGAAPALAALTVLAALAAVLPGARPAAASEAPAADRIVVTGAGAVPVEPDTLTADLAVETSAATVEEALDRAGAAAARMRDALVRAGLTRADLQTSNVTVSSQRDDKGAVTGYTAGEGITATIRDLPRAGAVMAGALTAGGDAARLNGVSYAVGDDTAPLAAARRKAFADARAKAELYAHEAGRPLGRVLSVREEPTGDAGPGRQYSRVGADAPLPIEPGRQLVTAAVTVQWALPPA